MQKKSKHVPSVSYKNAQFTEFSGSEDVIHPTLDNDTEFSPDPSQKMIPNYHFLDKAVAKRSKFFMMDGLDVEMSNAENEKNAAFLQSLTAFMKKFDYKKKIYIRHLPTMKGFRFFVDDVLEIIPLALRQQGNPIRNTDARLRNLREEWALPKHLASITVTMEEFEKAVEMFNVNKSLITIIPDFEFSVAQENHFNNMRGFLSHVNHNGTPVVFNNQAMHLFFMECIVGFDWTSACEPNGNCNKDSKQLVNNMMFIFQNLDDSYQMALDKVMPDIQKIKSQCFYVQQEKAKNTDHLFLSLKPDDPAPNDELKRIANEFNILQDLIPKLSGVSSWPVWQARIILFAGWIASYCGQMEVDAKTTLIDVVCSVLPHTHVEEAKKLMKEFAFTSPPLPHISDDSDDDDVDDEEESECDSMGSDCYGIDPDVFQLLLKKHAPQTRKEFCNLMKNRKFRKEVWENRGTTMKPRPMRPPPRNVKKSEKKKKENDGWKDYSEDQLDIFCDSDTKEDFVVINGDRYSSNYSPNVATRAMETPERRLFYFNITKYKPIIDRLSCNVDPLQDLEAYSKFANDFVVRSMETSKGCFILTNDILELIPILLKKQGAFSTDVEKKLEMYQKNWDSGNPEVMNSVEVSFFRIIIDSLKIDRSLLTIIPDVSHLESMNFVVEKSYISTEYGYKERRITSKEQAIWHIFQSVVCGVNWGTKSCKKNREIVDDFKEKYFEEAGKLMKMRKGTFVTAKYIESIISLLHSHQVFTDKIVNRVADFNFDKLGCCDDVSLEDYLKNCKFYGIPKQDDMYTERQNCNVPAYLARSRNHLGWLNIFYSLVMLEEKEVLIDEMLYGFPESEREEGWEFLMRQIGCEVPSSAEEEETDEMTDLKKLIENPTILEKMQKATATSKSSEKEKKTKKSKEPEKKEEPTPSEEEPNSSKPPPPEPIISQKPKKAPKKPKSCTRCTENGVGLLNAREQLKKSEFSAKHNETKAKKMGKVEAKLENMTLKMKELETEIENLYVDLSGFDDKEHTLKKENKEIRKDIGNLEDQVEREKQKNAEVYQKKVAIERKYEYTQLELAKKESEQESMKAKGNGRRNPAPSTSSDEPSTFHVPFIPSLPTTDDLEQAEDPKWVLEQWKKMRTDFQNDEMVQDERDMIEELLSKSKDLELDVRNLAEYEHHQFEATCRMYLQNIDLNIMKIEKTENISGLKPLAKYPCLSKEFQIEYGKYMGSN